MDPLIIAIICGLSFGVCALAWNLWVRPELVLSLLDPPGRDRAEPADMQGLRWLRLLMAVLVLLFGFITGAVLVVLARSAQGA